MSANVNIVSRLNALADAIELGNATPSEVRDTLLAHTEAVERVPYSMVKEAQLIWGQLTQAIEDSCEQSIDVHSLGDWLRGWAARVPV